MLNTLLCTYVARSIKYDTKQEILHAPLDLLVCNYADNTYHTFTTLLAIIDFKTDTFIRTALYMQIHNYSS